MKTWRDIGAIGVVILIMVAVCYAADRNRKPSPTPPPPHLLIIGRPRCVGCERAKAAAKALGQPYTYVDSVKVPVLIMLRDGKPWQQVIGYPIDIKGVTLAVWFERARSKGTR